jgi:hypothetical protein
MSTRHSGAILWAAIVARPGQAFTSRSLAFATGLPVNIVSALLRRYADRGQIISAGLAGQQAKGGLRATVWRLPGTDV